MRCGARSKPHLRTSRRDYERISRGRRRLTIEVRVVAKPLVPCALGLGLQQGHYLSAHSQYTPLYAIDVLPGRLPLFWPVSTRTSRVLRRRPRLVPALGINIFIVYG